MDKKALSILFNAHWSGRGWKDEREINDQDFAYAKKAGYMFSPISISHDEAIVWLKNTIKKIKQQEVAKAFVASLSTQRLELRSALGSYACGLNIPQHDFQEYSEDSETCKICGLIFEEKEEQDLNVLNFERFKWGGVRHDDPVYAAFDLEQFLKIEKIEPQVDDYEILKEIVKKIETLPKTARASDIEIAIAKTLPSNKAERRNIIAILSFCGILETKKHQGFLSQFTPFIERTHPPSNKNDWEYPIRWWRGEDGINKKAFKYVFGDL